MMGLDPGEQRIEPALERQDARAVTAGVSGTSRRGEAYELFRDLDARRSPEELHAMAHIKRFVELVQGDQDFRQALAHGDRRLAAEERGLEIDPFDILPLYDHRYLHLCSTGELDEWPLAKAWSERVWRLRSVRDLMRREASTAEVCPQFESWRERQIRRNDSELGERNNEVLSYPLVAFELSQGCTVGCWFCGLSAESFRGNFRYTAGNARLWRECLETLQDLLGPGIGTSFCYWATDPMDNPDYLRFIEDFHRVTGRVPQTTTAAPLADVARTRRVLDFQRRHRSVFDRFSIITLKDLHAVHREFSPEEMLDILLVLQHKEAVAKKRVAGRALVHYERLRSLGKAGKLEPALGSYGTIACFAGFLVRMVPRSVELVSPCKASVEHPDGYIVWDRGSFADARGLRDACERMIASRMPERLAPADTLAFRKDLRYQPIENGFSLAGGEASHLFCDGPYLRELGDLIAAGGQTVASLRRALVDRGADFFAVGGTLGGLFAAGLLDETRSGAGEAS